MKKIIVLALTFIIACSFWGCTGKSGSDGAKETSVPLPYTYSCVKCVDNQTADIKDNITVIKSVEELESYKKSISDSFIMDKGIAGEDSATLAQKFSVFNENYFTDKVLVVSRRNFVTEDELTLLDGNKSGGTAIIESELSVGGEYEKSVRFFLIQIKNEYFADITDISINITTKETTTSVTDVSMMISKGENAYKAITDSNKIAEIQNTVNSFKYKETEYSSDNYEIQPSDITISYQGYVAIFSDTFIYIDGQTYTPNDAAKQKIVDLYNSLTEFAQTVPAETFESDEGTT